MGGVGEGAVQAAVAPGAGATAVHAAGVAAAVPAARERLHVHVLWKQQTSQGVEDLERLNV